MALNRGLAVSILRLDIEGFRSLRHVSWEPRQLNVVIGPNGGGKSNLLRALEMLSVAAKGGLGRHVQREGGIVPLLWDGRAEQIRARVTMPSVVPQKHAASGRLTYELALVPLGATGAFVIDSEALGEEAEQGPGGGADPFRLLERDMMEAWLFREREGGLVAVEGDIEPQEALLAAASGPLSIRGWLCHYQRQLASWAVHHELHTHREAPLRAPSVARSESRLDPNGQNLIVVLHTLYANHREFKSELDTAMRAAFGDDFDELVFPPAADQRIQLRVRWRTLRQEQSSADLSDGTLRFLFLLAALANPDPPPLIAIDEPETGLHPAMFPIIAEQAAAAAEHTQVILTTHSPDFLDAFGDSPPTTTVVENQGGETQLRVLNGDSLEYWLKQYTLGELYRSHELEAM